MCYLGALVPKKFGNAQYSLSAGPICGCLTCRTPFTSFGAIMMDFLIPYFFFVVVVEA